MASFLCHRQAAQELLTSAQRAAINASLCGTAAAYGRAHVCNGAGAASAERVGAKRLLNNTLLQAVSVNKRKKKDHSGGHR